MEAQGRGGDAEAYGGEHAAALFLCILVAACLFSGLCYWIFFPALQSARQQRKEFEQEAFFHTSDGHKEPFPSIDDEAQVRLSVVAPAFDEEKRISGFLEDAFSVLEDMNQRDSTFTYEIIVVDDGSRDKTVQVVSSFVSKYGSDRIRILRLAVNRGKGGAVRLGVLRSRGEYILMADSDGATEMADIKSLQTALDKNLKMIVSAVKEPPVPVGIAVGSRAHLQEEAVAKRAWYRTVLMYGFHMCVYLLCSQKIKDTQCGFKLFTREAAKQLFSILHLERWAFDVELIYLCECLGFPMVEIPVHWTEVEGSKLIQTKWDIVTTSLSMARDMLCVRLSYLLGLWTTKTHTRMRKQYRRKMD